MRPSILLVAAALLPLAARADEVDLTRSRRVTKPPALVFKIDGGNEFAPYGMLGGCISYLTESEFEFELGAGGGFPGLQLGLAVRRLFGERGSYLLAETALAGNTRVNRGASDADRYLNGGAIGASSSQWGSLGFGFEQRQDFFSFGVVGSIVLTTASLTPHWSVHGGLGLGF